MTDTGHSAKATERLHQDGIVAFCEGNYTEALRLLGQANLLSPNNIEIMCDTAHAHLHLGQRDQAFRLYRRLWERDVRSADVAFNLALLLLDQGQCDEALAAIRVITEEEIEIEPGRYYLGLLYPSAKAFLAECHLYHGIANCELGQGRKAIEHFNRALEFNPRLFSAHQALIQCLMSEQQWEGAYERCRDLLALAPSVDHLAGVRVSLARAHFEMGRTDQAVTQIQEVLSRDPGHREALEALRHFEEKTGSRLISRPTQRVSKAEVASPLFGLTRPAALAPDLEDSELVIIGQSQAMRRVMRHARLAAASNATVLLTGENGTGKELIARAIYLYSPRRDKPMVTVNCAALPETLLESELFGHERGSFTGAHEQKKGRFEIADNGTIFLDEVGEMSLALQVKLLRVLQEKEFTRVGGTETLKVDVRIIAATNLDLQREVATGRFRQDLFYRLNVLPINLPPLRERREDIPLVVEHFLRRFSGPGRAGSRQFTEEEMEIIMDHPWPGNVRELENFIERAVVMGQSGQQLVEEIHHLHRRDQLDRSLPEEREPPCHSGNISLEEVERNHILRVLDECNGNQKRASEILGINPSTLWRKMKKYQKGGE